MLTFEVLIATFSQIIVHYSRSPVASDGPLTFNLLHQETSPPSKSVTEPLRETKAINNNAAPAQIDDFRTGRAKEENESISPRHIFVTCKQS